MTIVIEHLQKRWVFPDGQSRVFCQGNTIARVGGAAGEFSGSALPSAHSLLGSLSSPSRADGAGAAMRVLLRGTRICSGPLRSQLMALWSLFLELGRCCSFFSVVALVTPLFPAISSCPCLLLHSQHVPDSVPLPASQICSIVLPHYQ